jgi:hypothetical protein
LLHFGDHDPNIAENLLFSIRASVSSRSNLSIVKTNFLSQIARRSNQLIPPGRVIRMAAALGILLAALAFSSSHAATVTTNGFDLFVNGSRMVIKGMNYSPVPIGVQPSEAPYGDYFVPEYQNVWMPDIQNMRAAGVNAIKLYAGNPALNAGQPDSAGNWKQFLDACYNGGTNPIYVVMFSYIQGDVIAAGGAAYQQYITDYQNLVRSTVTHPAILGYCVGNEIFGGVTSNAQFWINFGNLLNAAKEAGQEQNATPFLMTATNDDYTPAQTWPAIQQGETSGQLTNLDAWAINVYRGPLFGGAGNSVFVQYQQLMTSLNKTKPLILGEWGTPHSTRPAVTPPTQPPPGYYGTTGIPAVAPINLDTIPQNQMGQGQPYFAATTTSQFLTTQWQTIRANVGAGTNQVCVGGFIFDWSDEYWKAGDASNHLGGPDQGFKGGAFAGGYADEAWYGITSAVDQSQYGNNQPNINRTLFAAYAGIQAFYTSTTHLASPLYGHPVFGAPNPDRPVIDIERPTRKSIITKEETVVIRGTASGGGGIDQILVRGPRERYQLATGTTDWSSQEDLRLGSNRFTIKAVGATGDTTTKTITIYRIPDHRRDKNHWRRDRHR